MLPFATRGRHTHEKGGWAKARGLKCGGIQLPCDSSAQSILESSHLEKHTVKERSLKTSMAVRVRGRVGVGLGVGVGLEVG